MKFNLYNELLNDNDIMSFVFLDSIEKEMSKDIADEIAKNNREDSKETTFIDISLTINGVEVNPRAFFDNIERQLEGLIKKEATRLVKKQTSNKFSKIIDKLNEYEQITDSFASEINWDLTNIFEKRIKNKK